VTEFGPADERRHRPGEARSWCEWWCLDFARDDGFGGFVRLALYPNTKVAWYWAYLVTPDDPGPIVVRDHEVALPRTDALEVRADGLWSENTCETPFEHWTYGLEAFGVRLDDPADAFRGEIGERLPVGFDLEWEVLAPRFDESSARYEQAGVVHGEVLIARDRIALDTTGVRTHGWGDGTWSAGSYRASFQHADSFAMGITPGGGYIWRGGTGLEALQQVSAETHMGDHGVPVAARFVVDDTTEVAVDVLRLAPVPLEGNEGDATQLVRSLCRFDVGDRAVATGWAEWASAEPA
jgi:hypothetical protein